MSNEELIKKAIEKINNSNLGWSIELTKRFDDGFQCKAWWNKNQSARYNISTEERPVVEPPHVITHEPISYGEATDPSPRKGNDPDWGELQEKLQKEIDNLMNKSQ